MSRLTRLVHCVVVVAAASAAAVAASRLEAHGVDAPLGAPVIFSGLAVGVFVTVLVAGTMILGRAAERKPGTPWATLMLLAGYLVLAIARHRTAPGAVDVVTDLAPPVHANDDTLLMITTTLGLLCVLTALAELRRLVRLAPVAADTDWKASAAAEAPHWNEEDVAGSPELPATPSLRSLDEELAAVPLMEEPAPPDLDAVAAPPAPADPAPAPAAAGRAKRLFE